MNIKLILSFDGTNYHGWQAQENASTIQGTLLPAIQQLMPTASAPTADRKCAGALTAGVQGCSRTDAGVHAREYVCNFHTEKPIPIANIPRALNSLLPPDIRILSATPMPDEFNSRFDVKSKTYIYTVDNNKIASPFSRLYSWHFPYSLNINEMKKAAMFMVGEKDFSCFSASGDARENRVRIIYSLEVERTKNIFEIKINANAYLYNMVRIIAGTLVEVGNGKIPAEKIPQIIESKDRRLAGTTAPAHGLSLYQVHV